MKYWELINVGGKTSAPTSAPQQAETPVVVDIPGELSDNVKKIMAFMEEMKNKDNTAPVGYEDTTLNSDEIVDVVTMLLDFQKKYFKDVPLTDTLQRNFIWNIPRDVYDAAKKMKALGEPDCLNPIYWMYLTCLEDPGYMMAKFIVLAINSATDEDFERVSELADMYDKDNGITHPDDDEDTENNNMEDECDE